MRILVTGSAGFIGASLVQRLQSDGRCEEIVGVDSLEDRPVSLYAVTKKSNELPVVRIWRISTLRTTPTN